MIDPKTILICTPAMDGRVEAGFAGGLMDCAANHLFGNITFSMMCSDIRLARNLIADKFLSSPFEWMLSIDSDIAFTSEDVRILFDFPRQGLEYSGEENNPAYVTVNDQRQALMVMAEYAKKIDGAPPARFGLGFTRIHRSVFSTLLNATDSEGTPRVGQFVWEGRLVNDFFPNGPGFEGIWFGEDTGFVHLCRLCGITPRVEQRTRLVHIGRKAFGYTADMARPVQPPPVEDVTV